MKITDASCEASPHVFPKSNLRRVAAMVGALIASTAFSSARADVPISGSFVATQACPAYQSFRKETNPGDIQTAPSKSYEVIAKNKPNETHYRIIVDGADPEERWVSASCGHLEAKGQETPASPPSPGAPNVPAGSAAGTGAAPPGATTAKRATHVLALSWEPNFCGQHSDKSECREISASSFDATHLSLHGLWPQPRGTQYCNVPTEARDADDNHDWNALPEPDITAETKKRLAAVMPGVESNLQRHEWIVHGTCFGTNADAYFTRAASLAETVNASKVSQLFADNVGKSLSADAIRAAFDASFGAGAGARVTISCHGHGDDRKITELVINLAGDVKGSAPLSDLIQAAPTVPESCPGGFIDAAH